MHSLLEDYNHPEHAMILRLDKVNLLVPDIMVEEVFWPEHVQSVETAPHWFLGYFDWGAQRLPLISFEKMNGLEGERFADGMAVVIINGSVNHQHLPFYGMLIAQSPDLLSLQKKSIAPEFGRQTMRAEACWTTVDGELAVIPKVDWVEEHLLAYVLNR